MSNVIVARMPRSGAVRRRERDFLLLNIYVFTRHGYFEQARILADALYLAGETGAEVLLARAVSRFLLREWTMALAALDELDRADPIERFGSYQPTPKQRMRRYLKARCLHELGMGENASDALDAYLRHGVSGAEEPE